MADVMLRRWCAVIAFPEREPILFGTAHVRHGAPDHEIEAALTSAIRSCLPDGWVLRTMVPGSIFFIPEEALAGDANG